MAQEQEEGEKQVNDDLVRAHELIDFIFTRISDHWRGPVLSALQGLADHLGWDDEDSSMSSESSASLSSTSSTELDEKSSDSSTSSTVSLDSSTTTP